MQPDIVRRKTVSAVTHDVMPRFGVAYVVDDQDSTWTITKSTRGPGLDALEAGRRVVLTLEQHDDFSLVTAYDVSI